MCLHHICTLLTFLSAGSVIIIIYISLDYCHLLNYYLDLSSYVFIPLHCPCHLRTNLTCHHTYLSQLSTLTTFLSTWCHHMCKSHHCHLLLNLICNHTCLSHLSTLPTSYQLDLLSYVSIPPLYPCHLLVNLICHHMFLLQLFTYATSVSTWSVIIRVYPTYLPLPSYQLHQSSYASIPHIYPCHILTNLICHYIWLSHISTLDTFLSVIICVYSTSLPLSPSFNLICHQMCLSHIYTLSTLLSTWPVIIMCLSHISILFTSLSIWSVIICVYPTSLTLSSPDQFDLSSYTDIPISTFATFLSTCHSHLLYIWYHTY